MATGLAVALSLIAAVPSAAEARGGYCFPKCGDTSAGPKCSPGGIWHPDADGMGGGWCEYPKKEKCTFWWRCPKQQATATRRS